MSIYSNNRTGVATTATLVANESYKSNDIGRILYESAVNDMAFFEAVIASDFNEIKGLREGTLLEAEVAALNEASAKEFFKGMAERVKKFWAKIKGAIKAAVNKLAAYVLKDGKAFVAEFEAAEKKYGKFAGKIEGVKLYNGGITIPTYDTIDGTIKAFKGEEGTEKAYVLGAALGECLGEKGDLTPADFKKKAVEKCMVPTDVTAAQIDDLKKRISSAPDTIKGLKENEKYIDKCMGALEAGLKAEEKNAFDKENGDKSALASTIKRISMLVSVYETVVATSTAAVIGCTKATVAQSRKALSQAMSEMKKESAEAKHEAAAVAEDEVEVALDDASEVEVDIDTQDAIDQAVEAVESEEAAANA